ncbi:Transposon Ty3-I Gag-Pol polyprotein [Araneus ventricosus]|uniref:Transposon Ty3-I Gag-Pol polyprotein n=1 Tax=Araneus ventricosus TaxID=182803 RepID=A0A4Y2HD22_ARAVE|nr:Transposon Ty3-I Gag-Pol polyprotein [Araneus ventricosus]GBM63186.1 Transposon Ty3-I Gag-Pol polyprotein [Araneus ventricosus]
MSGVRRGRKPSDRVCFTLNKSVEEMSGYSNLEHGKGARQAKKWYDKGTVERTFKPGDLVLVMATIKPNKLAASWMGPPDTVIIQISETNYRVSFPNRREKSQIFHINLLKLSQKGRNCKCRIERTFGEGSLKEKCTPEELGELERVLNRHRKLFSNDPGRTDLIEHNIVLISDQHIRIRPYRTSPRQTEILKQEIKRMLDLGVIEVGESYFSSPLILVEVPGKDQRPCIDYRKLNSVTRAEYFPLPNIEERVKAVASAKYITVIDLTKGYWQIPLSPQAQKYAAFSTPFGSYRPLTMPFGLLNAPYCFSKFMATLSQV